MNGKVDFTDLASLIDDFATTNIAIPDKKGNDSGNYDESGEWIPNNQTYTLIHEPIVPSSQQAKYDYQPGGQVILYDATWYSHHSEFQVGDQINDRDANVMYQIANKTDYSRFANVIEYGLKAVTK